MSNTVNRLLCAIALIASASAAQIDPIAIPPIDDAPHLFHQADGSVRAVWIEASAKKTKVFAKGQPIALPRFERLLGKSLRLIRHAPDAEILELPEKMLVLSDVEGEFDSLVRFLRANDVIDDHLRWTYDKGHLVTVGDMVDRGSKVTEVLWLMYSLHRQAKAAGGAVHFVLGNHETMIMGKDLRYIAPKYQHVTRILGVTYDQLVGPDTEIGRWLRARNSLVRIGDFLFVHAGIAPSLRGEIEDLNRRFRAALGVIPPELAAKDRPTALLVWGTRGPFWFRGYFKPYAEAYPAEFGPHVTTAQIDGILERYSAKTIVVGHTKVKRIADLYGKRRVLAIDTPWTDIGGVRGLVVRDGELFETDVKGQVKPLPK